MPAGDDIEIPQNVVVRCPLKSFDLAHATGCDGCEHFAGLSELLASPTVRFQRRYAVRCRYPIDRELAALAE